MNFRIPEALDRMVEVAVEVSGAESRSAFARDCLEAGARKEIAEHRRTHQPAPLAPRGIRVMGVSVTLGGGFQTVPGRCLHPETAIKTERPDLDYCGLCGVVVRAKL